MSSIIRACSFVALLVGLLFSSPSAVAQHPVEAGVSYPIKSQVLQEERQYTVKLPAAYKWRTGTRYPTLYVLDGKTHFLHTAGSTDLLSASGEIPEMIVVAVASTVRIRDFTQSDWREAWVGGGGAGKFKQFLLTELIPEIEARYRTNGFRILSGHSASAQFVLHVAATSPEAFRGYLALAPSLDWDKRLPARELEAAFRSWPNARAFLFFAYGDDAGQALADDKHLEGVLQKAPPALRHQSRAYPGETHSSLPLLAQIDGLRGLYAGYRYHNDWMNKGVAAAEAHYRDVSERLGWPVPVPESVINALAYEALAQGRVSEAVQLFERNTAAHQDSANAFDSLAEGYVKAGRQVDAARAAAKSAEIAKDPDHPDHAHYVRQAKELAEAARPKR